MGIIFDKKKKITNVNRALSLLFTTIDAIKLRILRKFLTCKNVLQGSSKVNILIPVIFKRLKIYR